MKYPTKYVSEESEKFIKKEDYKNLINLFRKYYPELFKFEHLKKRLDFYDLEANLKLLVLFPNEEEILNNIKSVVKLN